MKFLVILSILAMSVAAQAVTYQYGDVVSGSVTAPSGGTIIADSGALTFNGPNYDFYNTSFTISCTLACNVTFGIYTSGGTAVRVQTVNVGANDTKTIAIPHYPATASPRFEIVVNGGSLGQVSGGIFLALNQSY